MPKENPIAKEAMAEKAEANPSKIEESKEKVAEQKEQDLKRKPSHNDLMKSMRAQTKVILEKREKTDSQPTKGKPSSFPPAK